MPTSSPTPMTDAMQRVQFEGCTVVICDPETMEKWERELAEAKSSLETLQKVARGMAASIPNYKVKCPCEQCAALTAYNNLPESVKGKP